MTCQIDYTLWYCSTHKKGLNRYGLCPYAGRKIPCCYISLCATRVGTDF